MGWDGTGWDGMGWDGMGWDGMRWDGMGWDEMRWIVNYIPLAIAIEIAIAGMYIQYSTVRTVCIKKPIF